MNVEPINVKKERERLRDAVLALFPEHGTAPYPQHKEVCIRCRVEAAMEPARSSSTPPKGAT